MFLLDTNVVSELRRPEKADGNVAAWAGTVEAASFFLSAITILEIELGTLQISRRDAAQGALLKSWMDEQILPRLKVASCSCPTLCPPPRPRPTRATRCVDRCDSAGSRSDGRHPKHRRLQASRRHVAESLVGSTLIRIRPSCRLITGRCTARSWPAVRDFRQVHGSEVRRQSQPKGARRPQHQ
jgi:hypothetical protein